MAKANSEVQKWLGHISSYDRAFKKWEARVEKIIKRYRDDSNIDARTRSSKFNILWSNVQTLSAATFARLPKPDVSRRFRDNDPVGRVASLILERALDYEVSHYSDYRATLKADVLDRFLGGRATAWARYEPHIQAKAQGQPVEGLQPTEDVEAPGEVLEYECAPVDYVHWKDFGHVIARTWEEVPAVWRKVYMTREALVSRFKDKGNKVPLDARPEDFKKNETSGDDEESRGCVYEIWDKSTQEAIWIAKSIGEELDRRKDPLELEEFFPCPKPMFSTLANDKLEPVPDYCLYQDQAIALDTLSDRISGFIDSLKVIGTYDGSIKEITRMYTEAGNTMMVPIKNWAAYAEKGKLTGAVDIVSLEPIYMALKEAYLAMEQVKNQVYEITGISDIIRGQTEASETATAQQIKGNYASLRLKTYQEQVAEFATELLQIKAQIMCNKFSPETLLRISAADQLNENDKQHVPAAMVLLLGPRAQQGPDGSYGEGESQNPLRSFRVEIAADSLVYLDEKQTQDSRVAFLAANSDFMAKYLQMIGGAGPLAGPLIPLTMELWKFSVSGFKAGKSIEGAFDEATEQMKKIAAQPPQQAPDPALVKIQAETQAEAQRQQFEQQRVGNEQQFEVQKAEREAFIKDRESQAEAQRENRRIELDNARAQFEIQAKMDFETWRAKLQEETKREIAQIQAKCSMDQKAQEGQNMKRMEKMTRGKTIEDDDARSDKQFNEIRDRLDAVITALNTPKERKVVRDKSGRMDSIVERPASA